MHAGLRRLVPLAIAAGACLTPVTAGADRFERLWKQDMRVATVAYRLSVAGAALCRSATVPQSGIVLHSAVQYGLSDAAAAAHGIGDRPTVLGVVAGSPADRAGLSAQDEVLAIDDAPAGTSVNAAKTLLADALGRGVAWLLVAGPSGRRQIRFHAAPGCPTDVEVLTNPRINAWADGARVTITTGIVQATRSDDELAIVIAHEMAHNILRHCAPSGAEGAASALLPAARSGGAALAMRAMEEQADRFAVGITEAAGYDLAPAVPFLRRLLAETGIAKHAADTHPSGDRRVALLTAAIAQTLERSAQRRPARRIAGNTSASARVSGKM
ncbi:M48 family metalloprotease [Sphingomonas bacterium]|uniref:M48 family metalloprotease n=1 Tax=Sphingomonas bacterium TaxID=1895847 RepID=UPI002603FDC1|nr:M48 family metalloprotease [Sphingomonas bacterium]